MTNYATWSKTDLIKKIQELEAARFGSNGLTGAAKATEPEISPSMAPQTSSTQSPRQPAKKKAKEMDFSRFSTRKVAIRFAYAGWNYHGLAVQTGEDVPTIEGHILAALHRTKLIPSVEPNDCELSRCGRTDRGVSAMRQVISLRLRSTLTPEEQQNPENDVRELNYMKMLNDHLPEDIRAYEICLRPPQGFDARFSCLYRHYHYYFHKRGLDIELMRQAARSFIGVHDFRNYCKVDPSKQITNFNREVMISEICQVPGREDLYYFSLRGTAFLWHQVRSMMAILFLVGQKAEPVDLVGSLLDVEKNPRRPVYEMAADYPLVLVDCAFPEMEWQSCRRAEELVNQQARAFNLSHRYLVRDAIASLMYQTVVQGSYTKDTAPTEERLRVNLGDGIGRPTSKYKPVMQRELLEAPEVVNARWLERKASKRNNVQ